MKSFRPDRQRGEINMFLITTIIFAVLAVGLGVGFAWAFTQMTDYRDNSQQKVDAAVASAKADQKKQLQAQFDEDYKRPNLTFTGPVDFGSVSFEYPRTWAIHVPKDGTSGGEFAAYFNPVSVPAINNATPFALRVSIVSQPIEQVLKQYEGKVKKGDLTSSTVRLTDASEDPSSTYGKGTRLDGQFDKTIYGAAVFFDIRGRTLKIFTDKKDFLNDFNKTILPTLKYRY